MLEVVQISSQFYLVETEAGDVVRVVEGPFMTREQAETMTKVDPVSNSFEI